MVREAYPLLAREERLLDAMREADLLFALHAQTSGEHDGPYSHGTLRRGLPAENGLRTRVRDPRQRTALATFFGLDSEGMETRLQELYTNLRFSQNAFPGERQLFPPAD